MQTARINSTPRLFPSGCSLSFVIIFLCAALCQETRATSDRRVPSFNLGEKVEARWNVPANAWYPATITADNGNGTYEVKYDDGAVRSYPAEEVRRKFSYEDKVEGFYTPDQTWYGATVIGVRPNRVHILWDDGPLLNSLRFKKVEHVRFKPMNSWEQGQCERVLIDDLTAIVLQYAMHAGEAKQILTADPTLVHFYCEYGSGFEEPGVHVMGAGDHQLNGLYSRKEVREGPSNGFPGYCNWAQSHAGRYWYEKDDGCHIRAMNIHDTVFANTYAQRGGGWVICGSKGGARYKCHVPAEQNDGLPPAQGWETFSNHFDMFTPVPTLRVVA